MRARATGKLLKRTKGGDVDRITAYLPPCLGLRARSHALENRASLSDVFALAVESWLDAYDKRVRAHARALRAVNRAARARARVRKQTKTTGGI